MNLEYANTKRLTFVVLQVYYTINKKFSNKVDACSKFEQQPNLGFKTNM